MDGMNNYISRVALNLYELFLGKEAVCLFALPVVIFNN